MAKANNATKPKNISAHAWAKHKRLTAKAGKRRTTWTTTMISGS